MCSRPYRTSAATPNTPSAANAAIRSRSCCEGCCAVRPKQHGQALRCDACRQKQVRQRQHINKPDAEKPVRRALCERVGAEQRNAYIGNEPPSAAYRVADKMHHRDRHQHKGVKGNDASGGSIPSVNLIQSGMGQAPQAAQQQKDRHIEEAALADAAVCSCSRRSAAPARQG